MLSQKFIGGFDFGGAFLRGKVGGLTRHFRALDDFGGRMRFLNIRIGQSGHIRDEFVRAAAPETFLPRWLELVEDAVALKNLLKGDGGFYCRKIDETE